MRQMRISCAFPEGDQEAPHWVDDLMAALPGADVSLWHEGDSPADYAVVWQPPQSFLDSQTQLKAIFNAGAGVDAIAALKMPESVPLIRLEDAGMADQMSEYVAHAVLHHYREFDTYATQASKKAWLPRPPRIKIHYPVGILGFGVLGQAVASTVRNLGFPVTAWANTARSNNEFRVFAGEQQLDDFLRSARILVCLLPLTSSTRHILSKPNFDKLQRGGYLINVARGSHLIAADLVNALNDGQLLGATLDVFDEEPLPQADSLWAHPSIRLTPHISAATLREPAVLQIASKMLDIERGQKVSGVVARERGY